MGRPRNPIEPDDPLGLFPKFAKSFRDAQEARGWCPAVTATKLRINISNIYGYMKGHSRCALSNLEFFETTLCAKLDMSEDRKLVAHPPSHSKKTPETPKAPIPDNLKDLVDAICKMGYSVELRSLS